ncbi:amidase domain-containing protein [Staphylococcus canis]|uniref:Amidase domain-containing protein n=1 Tax=Staphylococcus canis TaxID=2724942 RepID=A0ABS0T903_9STAP|nr:amidase domain-containing protein [Staphylococcus canis]MBI5974436.1 amidase domain-containing protein [Staphylococcus canis]
MKSKYIVVGVLSTSLILPSFISGLAQATTESESTQDVKTKQTPSTEEKGSRSQTSSTERPKSEDTSTDETQSTEPHRTSEHQAKSNEPSRYHIDFFAPFKLPRQSSLFDTVLNDRRTTETESTINTGSSTESATSNETNTSSQTTDTVTDTTEVSSLSSEETPSQETPSYNIPDNRNFFDNLNAILSGELDISEETSETPETDSTADTTEEEFIADDTLTDEQDTTEEIPSTETDSSEDITSTEEPSTSEEDANSSSEGHASLESSEEHAQSTESSQQTEDASSDNSLTEDATISALLDEYSEKAHETHKDYQAQNETSDSKKSEPNNPQIPDFDTLQDTPSQAPQQSFKGDKRGQDLRQTTLFQTFPETNGNADYEVVSNESTRKFVNTIAKDAHDIGQKHDLYASVMIAQAILESDSGRSALSQAPHYNLFGMKGAYGGQSSTFDTLESNGHNMYQISASFRKYPNVKASLNDYAQLMKHGIDGDPHIYKDTWKSESMSYRSATEALVGTYATDPNYDTKLKALIRTYDLDRFDQKRMPKLLKSKDVSKNDATHHTFKPFSVQGKAAYPYGQCTWYVYHRFAQFGLNIAEDMGDAKDWTYSALVKGYSVSEKPVKHSAVVFTPGTLGADRYYGHVAFVEKVNSDGSIVISESNVKGLGVISYRTIDAETAQSLDYIKGK